MNIKHSPRTRQSSGRWTSLLALALFAPIGLLTTPSCSDGAAADDDDADDEGLDDSDGSGGSSGDGDGDDGDDGDDGGNASCDELREQSLDILDANCASCHAPGGSGASVFDDVRDVDRHLETGRLVAGNANESRIVQVVDSGAMPPGDENLTGDEIDTLRGWVDGCLAAAQCAAPSFIPFDEALLYMRDDIIATSNNERRFIRYFTLTHLNNAGLCHEELEPFRFGLSKAVNSLSSRTSITAPQAIDPDETIYRIDLRDYNWDAALWDDVIVAQSPYGVQYEQDDARDLQAFTETTVPFLFGDWFASDATSAPLYYEILDDVLGFQAGTLDQLGTALDNIDIRDNLDREDQVLRANFASSGVSVSNRVIERHEFNTSSNRSLWVSYDFATNVDDNQKNVLKTPLGPSPAFFSDGTAVDPATTFVPDGHGAIFTLPNGLQAYMVFDENRQRINHAPVEVMTDPKALDAVVVAGRSCISCHAAGINEKADEAVQFNVANPGLLNAAELQKLQALNPDFAELKARKDEDAQRYTDALAAAGIPAAFADEPIFMVFENFAGKQSQIDLPRAAAEFGLTEDQLIGNLGLIGLGQLASGGTVTRDSFENDYARNVCRLNLGTTDDGECG
jgi:hypothetical protein